MPGPNQFQVRRTSVADREANTITLPNAGELALNILDGRLFSTNGAVVFEVGANTKNCRVSNSFFVGNSVVNVFANSTIIQVSNSTVNTHLAVPTSGQYSATNYFLHANGSWVQVTGGGGSTRVYQSYTATGGQTTYTVSGGYTVGQIEVFENGVHLANTEYTQNGSTVVLTTGSLAGAIIEVSGWIALSSFTPVASGSDTWVQFNDATTIGATAGFTFDKATNNIFVANTVTVGGPINANGGIGSSGDVLKSNGTGSYWGTVSGGSVGGANTNVLFNDSTAANGVAGFTFDKDTNTAVVGNTLAIGTAWTANSTLVNANALNCRNQVNTATLFVSTTIDVGTNVDISSSQLFVGNSITNTTIGNNYIDIGNTVVNTYANSTLLRVANSTANSLVTPVSYFTGNSVANLVANSITLTVANSTGFSQINPSYMYNGNGATQALQSGGVGFWYGNNTTNVTSGTVTGSTPYLQVANTTGSANLTPAGILVGTSVVNSSVILSGGSLLSANVQTNPQTGTTYTLAASDSGKIVTCNNASAVTVTVPAGLPVGFRCQVLAFGDGAVTLSNTGQTGSLIFSRTAAFTITVKYGSASVFEAAANSYVIDGSV